MRNFIRIVLPAFFMSFSFHGCDRTTGADALHAGSTEDPRSDDELLAELDLDEVPDAPEAPESEADPGNSPMEEGISGDASVMSLLNPSAAPQPSLDLSAATPEEQGVVDLGLWNPAVGAFRSVGTYGGFYRFWTGDNALMLWAFAQPRYAFARSQGWGVRLREYLIDNALQDGHFSEGKKQSVDGAVTTGTPERCSPAMETQVLSGILAYTVAHGAEGAPRAAGHYNGFITDSLSAQHERIMKEQRGNTITKKGPGGVPVCPGDNHNFTNAHTIAYHVMNAAIWSKNAPRNRSKFKAMAREALGLLLEKKDDDGLFGGGNLRNAQILYTLGKAAKHGLRSPDLRPALARLVRASKKARNGGLAFNGGRGDLDTQALAYHMLAFKKRTFSATAFLGNRVCEGVGYKWKGKGDAPHVGPIEDQGMGLLGSAHLHARGWGLNGARCH